MRTAGEDDAPDSLAADASERDWQRFDIMALGALGDDYSRRRKPTPSSVADDAATGGSDVLINVVDGGHRSPAVR